MSSRKVATPTCSKCQQLMVWRAEEIVNSRPVQVFHCEICDKYSAEL